MAGRSVAIIGSRGYPSFYGGFETLVRRLAPHLADTGWDVAVYGRPGATVSRPEFDHPGVTSVTTRGIESKSLSTLSFGATSVLHSMTRRKPDVALVLNVANGYYLPGLRMRRIPTVVNVDGIEWERDKWSALGKRVFRTGALLTARFADILVSDSVEIGGYWKHNFRRDSVFIPYGGDVPAPLPAPEGLASRSYALAVARFVPENSIPEFLDAAALIAERHPVVIVGSSGHGGPLEERVTALCAGNGDVRWLGHVSDDAKLFALWQHAGAYFHGHSVGGTNPALVQAMACAAPTVARDTLFNREVLGEAAVFVAPEAGAIASAMSELIESPARARTLADGAQRRAAESYAWENICAAYENTLVDAIRRGG
ncbi:DUF1972 domain-containing protein [Tsukamurella sp. 8F]|uniref:DUF1972 domain-containing protein n=1 Tax=unclassified Tsukamurella TaxID=2633480 RepID=UPI0023B98677|nr:MULTISPECIES: DUF1972 domain-containing protein [unclassified Tsukamurella]MDF0530653.1 DUF1972 domain-containing protein [Tsukamurella sp. 8J]MDF0587854.1 DUF1972 domain-containing protein [Tsukamurella sp. 8F]